MKKKCIQLFTTLLLLCMAIVPLHAEETTTNLSQPMVSILKESRSGSFSNAKYFRIGERQRGTIYEGWGERTFKFQISSAGRVRFNATVYSDRFNDLIIYDNNGERIQSMSLGYNSNVGYKANYLDVYLYAGTYYVTINKWSGDSDAQFYIDTSFSSSSATSNSKHNSYANAITVGFNTTYRGMIPTNIPNENDNELYKLKVTSPGTYNLNITSYVPNGLYVSVYDANGIEANVFSDRYSTWNTESVGDVTNAGLNSHAASMKIRKAGTYYFSFHSRYTSISESNQGNYRFSIKSNNFVKLNKSRVSVYKMKGYSTTLKLNTNMSGKVVWTSSNNSVAKVTQKGTITGIKPGKATIRATLNGHSVTCYVSVENPSMTITQPSVSLKKGKSTTVKVRPFPTGAKVTYSSTNKKIATVTSTGSIRAVKAGTCRIRVSANGVTKYISVKVY